MEDASGGSLKWVLLVLLLLTSSILYGFTEAFERYSKRKKEEEDPKIKHEDHFSVRPGRLYSTVHLAGALSVLVLTYCWMPYLRQLFSRLFLDGREAEGGINVIFLLVSAAVIISVFLGIGVMAPQKIAAQKYEKWLRRYAGFVYLFERLLAPFTAIIGAFSGVIVRLFKVDPAAYEQDVTEKEVISMVEEGHEKGVFRDAEVEMIQNIFGLDDTDAKDVMTHRKNMVGIKESATLSEALAMISEENYSRYPIYGEDIDNVKGVLHIRDLLQYAQADDKKDIPLSAIPALYHEVMCIPETRSIDLLFREMQQKKNHLVIVVDEYGQTAGLVTMEDILEEIVGNIQDEYDEEEEMITKTAGGAYIMLGFTPLEDAADALQAALTDEDHETLNGYLISRLDHIPEENERAHLEADGLSFRILEVKDNAIRRVLVSRLDREEDAPRQHLQTKEKEA